MSRSLGKIKCGIGMFCIALVLFLSAAAQSDKAEAIFLEAKVLAVDQDVEKQEKAIAKFDEAASLFGAAGNTGKVSEVEREHGRLLRSLAVREMNFQRWTEAREYFNRALVKLEKVGDHIEVAFAYHDLGFITAQQSRPAETIHFYNKAIEAYRAGGDARGEATILRNLGLVRFNEKKHADALVNFDAAMKIRLSLGDVPGEAELHLNIGDVFRAQKKRPEAFARYTKAIEIYRKQNVPQSEASSLYKLGDLYADMFKYADSIGTLATALGIYEAEKLEGGEAETLALMGRVHMMNGKFVEAERALDLAAEIFRRLKDIDNEASVLVSSSINYLNLDRINDARIAAERSLAAFRESKNEFGEAYALLTLSDAHSYLNQYDEAMAKIRVARSIYQRLEPENADYRVSRALSGYHYSLANHGEAIRYLLSALRVAEREQDTSSQASIFVALGNSYSALGDVQRATEYTSRALETFRREGNRYMEAVCLNNLGYANFKLKNYPEAKSYLERGIAIMRKEVYERLDAYSTHNLGMVHYAEKNHPIALKNYEYALALYKKTGDRRPESFVYDSFGEVFRDLGQYEKAVGFFQKAIVLAREVRYAEIEAQALGNTMLLWTKRNQPRLAVLYGKQAVNVYQSIRAGNLTAEKSAQKSFVQSNEKTYRQLANVLIDDGRLAEAQQVLDLLKAEEYFEFVRRDAAEADKHAAVALNETERKALEEYSRVSSTLTSLGVTFETLHAKRNKARGKLDPADEAEYQRVKKLVEDAGLGLMTFFERLSSEFSKTVEDGNVVTPQSIATLQADLRRVGKDVVLVSTYLLPERYRAIVTTGSAMVDRKVEYSSLKPGAQKLTGADINKKIFEFKSALQDPTADPRKLGKELYDIFVKPLEGDLKGAGAKTILWSLDGTLRYIPMAALSPDGKTYLADQYQNVVVTLGRQSNLFADPKGGEWRAIGAGVSKQHAGFSALPSVPFEIDRIVRDETNTADSAGELGGLPMLDEEFNLENLRNTVPQLTDDDKPFNVLHLATHFSLGVSDQDSALLLGDGTRLSLFQIERDKALDFKDVELLTLSACQTAVPSNNATGREVESLGMLAQKKGAKAVLATLWKVADESTSLFMAEFYRIKKANPTMNKAEAIRLAQKAMIDGRIKASGASTTCRSESFATGPKKDEFKCDPNAPFSHPYFWSPFVLIGNWR